jgi:hypothetical protein
MLRCRCIQAAPSWRLAVVVREVADWERGAPRAWVTRWLWAELARESQVAGELKRELGRLFGGLGWRGGLGEYRRGCSAIFAVAGSLDGGDADWERGIEVGTALNAGGIIVLGDGSP